MFTLNWVKLWSIKVYLTHLEDTVVVVDVVLIDNVIVLALSVVADP